MKERQGKGKNANDKRQETKGKKGLKLFAYL